MTTQTPTNTEVLEIRHNAGFTILVTGLTKYVTKEIREELKKLDEKIMFNNSTSMYCIWDFSINNLWFEINEFTGEDNIAIFHRGEKPLVLHAFHLSRKNGSVWDE